MDWVNHAATFVVQTLLQEGIAVIFGVLVANLIIKKYEDWRYGGWSVVVRASGEEKVRRPISPGKVKAIKNEPSDLSVFLKGVVSPYATLRCDILDKKMDGKLLIRDEVKREYIIDLDYNPMDDDFTARH